MKLSLAKTLTIFLSMLALTFGAVGIMPTQVKPSANSPLYIGVTFTVHSVLDQPDDLTMPGTCHTAANTCTLRAAIMQANRVSGAGATIILPAARRIS